ncbi:MAG: hypothetical protein H6Q28_738 [Bacteroidetes bacterium]|nr:hypothetical protein [Bacteroidota bacterium]MBP1679184.1 hypothetical protein [Bacteroidota bacterium]
MKRLAIATLVVALGFGFAMAQDKPATDKPAAPKATEKAKDAGCGEKAKDAGCVEMTGCCGESKSSKDKKAVKSQKPAPKPAQEAAQPAKPK